MTPLSDTLAAEHLLHELNITMQGSSDCRRVKSQARFGTEDEDGTTIMFDADSDDQADRFPFGC